MADRRPAAKTSTDVNRGVPVSTYCARGNASPRARASLGASIAGAFGRFGLSRHGRAGRTRRLPTTADVPVIEVRNCSEVVEEVGVWRVCCWRWYARCRPIAVGLEFTAFCGGQRICKGRGYISAQVAAGGRPHPAAGVAMTGAHLGHVSFRPVHVGCTPRCGCPGWRCRSPGCDP